MEKNLVLLLVMILACSGCVEKNRDSELAAGFRLQGQRLGGQTSPSETDWYWRR